MNEMKGKFGDLSSLLRKIETASKAVAENRDVEMHRKVAGCAAVLIATEEATFVELAVALRMITKSMDAEVCKMATKKFDFFFAREVQTPADSVASIKRDPLRPDIVRAIVEFSKMFSLIRDATGILKAEEAWQVVTFFDSIARSLVCGRRKLMHQALCASDTDFLTAYPRGCIAL